MIRLTFPCNDRIDSCSIIFCFLMYLTTNIISIAYFIQYFNVIKAPYFNIMKWVFVSMWLLPFIIIIFVFIICIMHTYCCKKSHYSILDSDPEAEPLNLFN